MIALIPMAGTMTSFGGIKTAIQRPMNCTEYKATSDNTPVPLNVTTSPAKQGKAFAGTQVAVESEKKETQYECVGAYTQVFTDRDVRRDPTENLPINCYI